MIEKQFDKQEGILLVTSSGPISLQELQENITFLSKADDFPRKLKILENAIDASAAFEHHHITEIVKMIEERLCNFRSIHHAVVHLDPSGTAYSMIASSMLRHSHYNLQVFSTLNAAREWLAHQL